jgi:hypothetical protein
VSNVIRRFAMAATMIFVAAVGTVVTASPAQAACNVHSNMWLNSTINAVQASHWRYCWDPDSFTYLTASIEKLVGGQWVLVAQASGHAHYYCVGTTLTWYRGNARISQQFSCG